MAKYYSRSIDRDMYKMPPIAPLGWLQLMRGDRAVAVMSAQDQICGLSRRLVYSGGLNGTYYSDSATNGFSVGSDDPDTGGPGSQSYPGPTDERSVGAFQVDVTPGCFLRARVHAAPSGQTQVDDGASGWDAGGAGGAVKIDCVWRDADDNEEETNTTIRLPISINTYAAPNESAGGVALTSKSRLGALIHPADVFTDIVALRSWTRPRVTCYGTIKYIGGVRAVDVSIVEEPARMAIEADDDLDDEWCSHFFDAGLPPSVTYPLQRASETASDGDPRLGTWHLMNVHHATVARLGPHLFHWQAANENTIDVTDVEMPSFSTTSTSYVGVPDTTLTSWDVDNPGLSISCGGYARTWDHGSPQRLRERVAVAPVIVRVLASDSGSDGSIKVQASPWSWVEIPITSDSADWYQARLLMPCGINPEQASNVQIFAKSASGTLDLYAASGFIEEAESPPLAVPVS